MAGRVVLKLEVGSWKLEVEGERRRHLWRKDLQRTIVLQLIDFKVQKCKPVVNELRSVRVGV